MFEDVFWLLFFEYFIVIEFVYFEVCVCYVLFGLLVEVELCKGLVCFEVFLLYECFEVVEVKC